MATSWSSCPGPPSSSALASSSSTPTSAPVEQAPSGSNPRWATPQDPAMRPPTNDCNMRRLRRHPPLSGPAARGFPGSHGPARHAKAVGLTNRQRCLRPNPMSPTAPRLGLCAILRHALPMLPRSPALMRIVG
jgi:hypothetical protein